MLNELDLEATVAREEYRQRLPELQARLYDIEQALFAARVPVLIIFEGWAGTSKIETIGLMTRHLDPRGVRVHSITPPRTSETFYPWLYRFWLKLPSYGQIAIFDRSWYREVLADRTHGKLDEAGWQARCEDIIGFERQLVDDGAIILKFWFHITRKEQKRRFRKLLADPLTAWQVTEEDRWQNRHYKQFANAMERLISATNTPGAPWDIVPATNKRYANLTVFETIIRRLETRLGQIPMLLEGEGDRVFDEGSAAFHYHAKAAQANGRSDLPPPPPPAHHPCPPILRHVDLSQHIDDKSYTTTLAHLQATLYQLGLQIYYQQRPVVLVFEGWDAAGKGGAIKRVTEKLDPRAYVVHPIAAPSGSDRERHYLYRFWRRLPPRGSIAIFDRSWYGRVLVERIEGFARPDEWQRAYAEINEFERQLIAFGTIICKFWLHISADEQLRRFEQRQSVPYKAWKLTSEDWRNREKWPQYEQAADEMLLRTSTLVAPWTIVEAEDKRFARVKVLQTLVQRLETELGKVQLRG